MLIEQTIRKFSLSHMVKFLCQKAEVSRSGYYAWLKSENKRAKKGESDWKDYELIKEIYDKKKGFAGALTIKMILEVARLQNYRTGIF